MIIECNNCKDGDDNIHVTHTVSFSRCEDAPITDVTILSVDHETNKYRLLSAFSDSITLKVDSRLNPSTRRTAAGFIISCELCHGDSMFFSAQHKGHEELGLVELPEFIKGLIGSFQYE